MAELVYPPVIIIAKTFFRFLGLRFSLEGTENIPRRGGAVMAISHVGYLDFTFAGLAAQPSKRLVRFMAKDAVFHHRISGPLMRGMHHIPVDRSAGAAAYQSAVRALQEGEIVGVFPEATISRSFQLKDFKSGAARMAGEAGVPLLPTIVWGSQRVWTKGRPRQLRRQHVPITVAIGAPQHVPADEDPAEATIRLKETMTAMLRGAQEGYPERPSGPDDRWWLPVQLSGTAPTLEEANRMDRMEIIERSKQRRQVDE